MPSEDTDIGAHLVALITNQDQVAQEWLRFVLAVESGLAIGFAFILEPNGVLALSDSVMAWGWLVIPVIGIVVSVAGSLILVRERKWQVWYINQFRQTYQSGQQTARPHVFPERKGAVSRQKMGYISKVVVGFMVLIDIVWLVIVALAVGKS